MVDMPLNQTKPSHLPRRLPDKSSSQTGLSTAIVFWVTKKLEYFEYKLLEKDGFIQKIIDKKAKTKNVQFLQFYY